MGTRFVMFVKEGKEAIGGLYGQFDGYPEGFPKDLLSYVARKKIVNGIQVGEYFNVINGPDDLVAHLITLGKIIHSNACLEIAKDPETKLKVDENDETPIAAGTIYAYNIDPEEDKEEMEWLDYVYIIEVPKHLRGNYNARPSIDGGSLKLRVYNFGKKIYDGTIREFLKKIEEKEKRES